MSLPQLRRYQLSDYVPEPAGLTRSSAPSRGWLAGWPNNCPTQAQLASPRVVRPRDGHVFGRPMDRRLAESTGWALQAAMNLHHEYRDILPAWELRTANERDGGQGGVACRAIRGTSVPSNHSNGTATDHNTKSNPMFLADAGVPVAQKRFQSTQSPILIRILAAGRRDWGGWWVRYRNSYADAMHIDYLGTPAQVAADFSAMKAEAAAIESELAAERARRNGTPPQQENDVNQEQVRTLQAVLNLVGATDQDDQPLVEDGIFGPRTEHALGAALDRINALLATKAEKADARDADVADAVQARTRLLRAVADLEKIRDR